MKNAYQPQYAFIVSGRFLVAFNSIILFFLLFELPTVLIWACSQLSWHKAKLFMGYELQVTNETLGIWAPPSPPPVSLPSFPGSYLCTTFILFSPVLLLAAFSGLPTLTSFHACSTVLPSHLPKAPFRWRSAQRCWRFCCLPTACIESKREDYCKV